MNWNSWAELSLNKARSNNPVEALSLRRSDSTQKKKKTDEPWKSATDNEPAQKNW